MKRNQHAIDVSTRHQVLVERVKSAQTTRIRPLLQALDNEVQRLLLKLKVDNISEMTKRELQALIRQIRKKDEKLLRRYSKDFEKFLQEFAGSETEFEVRALGEVVLSASVVAPQASKAWTAARTTPITATGELLKPFVDDWTKREIATVEKVIRMGYVRGWTVDQMSRAIRGTKRSGFRDGLLGRRLQTADTVIRTATQHVSSTSRNIVFEANKDIVAGYRWVSTLDSRTSTTCRSLDGNQFELGAGPKPPIHPNCRSTIVSLFQDEIDTVDLPGSRSSKGAEGGQQVGAGTTYYAWLKTQPADFQDAAIGPTRAALLRRGGLTAEEFARLNVGRRFEPLTLDEMRNLEPAVFERAGL